MLEDHVDSTLSGQPAHFRQKIDLAVEDGFRRSELAGARCLFGAPGCGDHRGTPQLRHLDAGAADAGAARVHQDRLTRAKLRTRDQHVPRGEQVERESGGFRERQKRRLAEEIADGDCDRLGASAVARLAEYSIREAEWILAAQASHAEPAGVARRNDHLVSRFPAHAVCVHVVDDARYLRTGNDRQWEPMAGDASPHPEIEVVEGDGAHRNQSLARPPLRRGTLLQQKLVETTMLTDDDCFHAAMIAGAEGKAEGRGLKRKSRWGVGVCAKGVKRMRSGLPSQRGFLLPPAHLPPFGDVTNR